MIERTRPIIGLNTDLLPATKTAPAQIRLNAGYFDAVLASGGLPVLLPPLLKVPDLDALLDYVDGVVLVGGLDLDPKRVGLPSHPTVTPMVLRREESDRVLVRRIVERRTPVLGIGVGMQQLNVAMGGTLILNLPDEQPKTLPHFDQSGGPHRHIVNLIANTKLDDIYGGGELRVNSAHHQAVRTVAAKMRVCATAPDGVVEAIESMDSDWFCVGVQWHPESDTASALDMQLFECFVQASLRESSRAYANAA